MKTKKRGHNEGSIRERKDGRFEVFRLINGRSTKFDIFLHCCINSFTLSFSDFHTFVLSDTAKHFNKNSIYHIHDPHLLRRKVGKSSRYIKYANMNTFLLKNLSSQEKSDIIAI